MGVDVWSHDSIPRIGMNDIMVTPAQREILSLAGLVEKDVMIADVERHLETERSNIRKLSEQPLASWFDTYHTLDEIFLFYRNLATTYPTIARYVPSIGKSVEGRDIPAFIIGGPKTTKKIYFEGGQHAREWVGHATVAYIAEQLLLEYATKPILVDTIQFVIVPVVNVDGYVFTWNSNRLWRKNRRANTGGSYGVDLNRNWDDHWGGDGSSSNPSSDTYHGTAPFSEPESKAAAAFYTQNGPYNGAIDYHSYSQLILRPYGWTTAPPPNEATGKLVGDGIRDAIRNAPGVMYTSEASWELYFTAGTAQDWFYAAGKAPLSYTIELRDTGTYGFQLPPAQIIPTGVENWAGFKYFATYILEHP